MGLFGRRKKKQEQQEQQEPQKSAAYLARQAEIQNLIAAEPEAIAVDGIELAKPSAPSTRRGFLDCTKD